MCGNTRVYQIQRRAIRQNHIITLISPPSVPIMKIELLVGNIEALTVYFMGDVSYTRRTPVAIATREKGNCRQSIQDESIINNLSHSVTFSVNSTIDQCLLYEE